MKNPKVQILWAGVEKLYERGQVQQTFKKKKKKEFLFQYERKIYHFKYYLMVRDSCMLTEKKNCMNCLNNLIKQKRVNRVNNFDKVFNRSPSVCEVKIVCTFKLIEGNCS